MRRRTRTCNRAHFGAKFGLSVPRGKENCMYLDASDVHNGSNDVVIGGGRVISLVAVAPVTKPTCGDLAQIVHGVFQHGCTLKVDVDNVFCCNEMNHAERREPRREGTKKGKKFLREEFRHTQGAPRARVFC